MVRKISLQTADNIRLDVKTTLVKTEAQQLSIAILAFLLRVMEGFFTISCTSKLKGCDGSSLGLVAANIFVGF